MVVVIWVRCHYWRPAAVGIWEAWQACSYELYRVAGDAVFGVCLMTLLLESGCWLGARASDLFLQRGVEVE